MKLLMKAIAATAAAAIAVSLGTFAFANDITTPAKPVETVNNEVTSNYM